MPALSSECVLPAPVCPYARMDPLYPASTSFSTGLTDTARHVLERHAAQETRGHNALYDVLATS